MLIINKSNINKPVIVSLTSWPKRINNVVPVCTTILNQTITPVTIELTLSTEEFNNIYDLPLNLRELIHKKRIKINWVKNNIKTFKKLIPVISKYYNKDYYLLTIDDDILYGKTYIEEMINNLKDMDSYCPYNWYVIGNAMIYNGKIFNRDFIDRLTNEIIDTGVDDSYIYAYLLYKNAKMSHGPNYKIKKLLNIYNELFPMRNYYTKNNRINTAKELSKKIWSF